MRPSHGAHPNAGSGGLMDKGSSLQVTRRAVRRVLFWIIAPLLSGCGPVVWDERTNGLEIVADVDDVFEVSLPLLPGRSGFDHLRPEIAGQAVSYLERGTDDARRREWFKFLAKEPGNAEISLFTRGIEGLPSHRDYSLKVKVRITEW